MAGVGRVGGWRGVCAFLWVAAVGCSKDSAAPSGPSDAGAREDAASTRSPDAAEPDARGDLDDAADPDALAEGDASSGPDTEGRDAFTADRRAPDAAEPAGCGAFSGRAHFTCTPDGNSRSRCLPGDMLETERCDRGCLRRPPREDSICLGTTDNFSCNGPYGTERTLDGDYYISAFGCWLDAQGVEHTDPGDNCIPSCLTQAKRAGLCDSADSGRQCEERLNWFTADGARFGCLTRLRVTNPRNNKALIAIAIDFGPGCPGERRVQKAVLDASGRVNRYLFGSDQGASERSLVHVVEVDDSFPLGPLP